MLRRNPARYLAPVALVTAAIVAVVIVSNNFSPRSPRTSTTQVHHPGVRRKYARARFYTVQAGDNLTIISTKTGVPEPRLEQLNPSLDPNSLQTGQRLRLRR